MVNRRAKGVLEAEVLAVLWAGEGPLSPEQVRKALPGELAYTTVMTILVRLYEKGVVTRQAGGRGYRYSPVLDQAGITAKRMQALLDGQADRAGVLSRFVDGLDTKTLASLRRALQR